MERRDITIVTRQTVDAVEKVEQGLCVELSNRETFMADRVMFGCDFPVLRYEKVMADWNAEGYSREVLEKVLYRNAETYFGANQGGNR